MKAAIVSTDQIVEIDAPGAPPPGLSNDPQKPFPTKRVMARVWEGVTENGVRFVAYISVIQSATEDNRDEFDGDLRETTKKPDDWTQRAIDMRFIV